MVFLLLMACGRDKAPAAGEDTVPPVQWETGAATDTAETGETAAETGETADTGQVSALVALVAAPDGLVVQSGASWALRLSAQDRDGLWLDVEGDWTSSAPELVSVADGVATALAAGGVELSATVDGLSASASVTVREDGLLSVTLRDAETGALIPSGSAVIGEGDRVLDEDGDGRIQLPVDTGGPVTVSAYLRGYVPATVWETVGRELVLPLRAEGTVTPESGLLAGEVDLSGVPEGDFGDIIVGLAASSLQGPVLLVDPDSLLATTRSVSIYGVDADVPENVYLRDIVEDYETPALAGPAAVWTLAGPLPILDLTAGFDETGDVFSLLLDHQDTLAWGWSPGGTVSAGSAVSADLAPYQTLDDRLDAEVGALPLGFSGDEQVLVLVGESLSDEGLVVTGFGLGSERVEVVAAPVAIEGSLGREVVEVAQVGGLGSGGALCAARAWADGDAVVLPALPEVPDVSSFDGASRAFVLSSDASASLVHVVITDPSAAVRDLYFDGGAASGILPLAGIPFSYGRTTWTLLALHPDTGTFEGLLGTGALQDAAVAEDAHRAARAILRF